MDKIRFACNKQPNSCVCCGSCCDIREKPFLHPDDDLILRKKIYDQTGIIYFFPLYRYTISLTENEKSTLEKEAKKRNVKLRILPKKIIFDDSTLTFKILDYFLDHDRCPFSKKDNLCDIYEKRPKPCRDFPIFPKEEFKIYSHTLCFNDVIIKASDFVVE
jgi:Fe-S-cluster containining protein